MKSCFILDAFKERNHYLELGVREGCSIKDIIKNYRKRAKMIHPDKHPGNEKEYTKLFQNLEISYNILKNYRKEYNSFLLENEKIFNPPIPKYTLNPFYIMNLIDNDKLDFLQYHIKQGLNVNCSLSILKETPLIFRRHFLNP